MDLSEVLKSSPVRATGFFAALLAIAGVTVGAGAWVQSVNSDLSSLRNELNEARAMTIEEERAQAISDINDRLRAAISIMDRKKIEIEELREEVRSNHGENLGLLEQMRAGLDQSHEVQVGHFKQRLQSELSEFKAWTKASITEEKKSLLSDVALVSKQREKVEQLSAQSLKSISEFEDRFSEALAKVDDFETVVRAYQAHLQSDLDKVRGVPEGALIIIGGERGCPEGFVRHARSLQFVFNDDLSTVKSSDFLQESTFDLGSFLSGQSRAIGFVAPNLDSPQTSYHGHVANVCKAE